jgi:hypothetical protein
MNEDLAYFSGVLNVYGLRQKRLNYSLQVTVRGGLKGWSVDSFEAWNDCKPRLKSTFP